MHEEKSLEEKLTTGDFDDKFIVDNINEWIKKGEFDILNWAIEGCYTTDNIDMLNFINITLHNRTLIEPPLSKTYIENLSNYEIESLCHHLNISTGNCKPTREILVRSINSEIYNNCLRMTLEITDFLQKKETETNTPNLLLNLLRQSPNKEIRLHFCIKYDDYANYLNDEDEHVRKVATIIANHQNNWENNYTEKEKKIIEFLKYAFELGIISFYVGSGVKPENKINVFFEGPLIAVYDTDLLTVDEDIFINIKDNRLIAAEIYRLVCEGKIILIDEIDDLIVNIEERNQNHKIKTINI